MTFLPSFTTFEPLTNFLLTAPTDAFLALAALAILGLTIGSFLNVVVYRGASNLSVSYPKRSFCPQCDTSLNWYDNIPLISYLVLSGKCRHCKTSIPLSYPLMEIFYGVSFPFLWLTANSLQEFLVFAIFTCSAGAAAAIDLKTYKLPDSLTLGGILAILALCLPYPELLEQRTFGGLSTFLAMAAIYHFGKLIWNKKTTTLVAEAPTLWVRSPEATYLKIAEDGQTLDETDKLSDSDLFDLPSQSITLIGAFNYTVPSSPKSIYCNKVCIFPEKTLIDSEVEAHSNITVTGNTKQIVHPICPMGWGDVKLMALCGCALGFTASFKALTIAAICGLLFLLTLRAIAKMKRKPLPEVIPFGPWIAGAGILVLILSR